MGGSALAEVPVYDGLRTCTRKDRAGYCASRNLDRTRRNRSVGVHGQLPVGRALTANQGGGRCQAGRPSPKKKRRGGGQRHSHGWEFSQVRITFRLTKLAGRPSLRPYAT